MLRVCKRALSSALGNTPLPPLELRGAKGRWGEAGGSGGKNPSEAGGGKIERYPVAVIDFERVQTPFIIGLWIFLACLGKIGKLQSLFL